LTRPSWPETSGSIINQTKVYWFDQKKNQTIDRIQNKIKLKKNIKTQKLLIKTNQNPEKQRTWRTLKNIQHKPNYVGFKSDRIRTNQGHEHVENHAMINNLAFIDFDYHLKTVILSKINFGSKSKPQD